MIKICITISKLTKFCYEGKDIAWKNLHLLDGFLFRELNFMLLSNMKLSLVLI
jgi:hypothetical protein